MTDIELLISTYPELHFSFEEMPSGLHGLIMGNQITIDSELSPEEQLQWMREEIGHYLTSVGNIADYDKLDNLKQEYLARKWGYRESLSRSELMQISEKTVESDYEIADDLGIKVNYLHEIGGIYGLHFKHPK